MPYFLRYDGLCIYGINNYLTKCFKRSCVMENQANKMKSFISSLVKSEEGVTAIEYALIAAGIAVAIAVIVGTLGNSVSSVFQSVVNKL